MRSLERKLLRELWRLRGQVLSIALVVATGVMTVVTMRGGYDSLVAAQRAYYRDTRFADVWAPLKRAPEALAARIAALPGVTAVETRVTFLATLDLEGLDAPAQGRFVSLPSGREPALNAVRLRAGRALRPNAPDEALLSANFAEAHGLVPGDRVRALINGRARMLDVVGIAISPEHTYAVPPGAIIPDDLRYGVLWMDREALGPVYEMDGAFNEVLLALAPGTDPEGVITRLDTLLDPWGGRGAYPRKDQLSHQILQGELDQNRVMGTLVPAIFLAVAVFLLNIVLARLVATQRTEIAILKAFGYRDRDIGIHYLMYALFPAACGCVLGSAGGAWLGGRYMELYGRYFEFPELQFMLDPALLLGAVALSTLAAATGALAAVRRAARLPPAEAMRPEPPARFRPGWIESAGIGTWLPASGRMIVRNLERKPLQALLSALGVAMSVALLVVGMFLFDGMDYLIDLQFRAIQREDVAVSFDEPVDSAVAHELSRLPGVRRVETFRSITARLRAGQRDREIAIQAMDRDAELRRIIAASGNTHPLPAEGVLLGAALAAHLHVGPGDWLEFELLEGRRNSGRLRVSGVVEDFMGLSAWMDHEALARLAGEPELANGAWLAVDEEHLARLNRALKQIPGVAGASSPRTMLASFQTQLADSLFVAVGFLVGFAGLIAGAVIYNGARIALSERGRELASLRVMGYRGREVAALLGGEQAVITLAGIPLGWSIGYLLSRGVNTLMQTDAYRIPFVLSARTCVIAAAITIIAALLSFLVVQRRIARLDLIAVLKTRE